MSTILYRPEQARAISQSGIFFVEGVQALCYTDAGCEGAFMDLTRDEVIHITTLCKVAMTDDELEIMRSQLSDILGHFETLQELDVDGVAPTGHLGMSQTVLREDSPRPSLPKEDVLANAPLRDDNYFRVHAVLDE